MDNKYVKQIAHRLNLLVKQHLRLDDRITVLAVWFKKSDKSKAYLMEAIISKQNHVANENLKPLTLTHCPENMGWDINISLERTIFCSPKEQLGKMIREKDTAIKNFTTDFEVLYFDPDYLSDEIMQVFNIKVEPNNLIKGWYLDEQEGEEILKNRDLVKNKANSRPTLGVMQTSEACDVGVKVGIMHVEVGNQWLPSTDAGAQPYSWYSDSKPGYFLFRGGSIYKVIGFEVKRYPEFSKAVVRKNENDEYIEVHLSRVN